jgi:tight adherence protein B
MVAALAALAILIWPGHLAGPRLAILRKPSSPVPIPLSGRRALAVDRARRLVSGRRATGVPTQDLVALLEALAPALEAGIAPASALRIAADARSVPGRVDPLTALVTAMASAAADGAALGQLWREAAVSAHSPEMLTLGQAWSLTEDMGVPLARAVRTTARLLDSRIAHERRLAAATAGAKATVNVLTVLPIGGPLVALVLGIGPGELYGSSRITQSCLVLGLALAGVGRWWVRRMVRAVARGPVIG